MYPRWIPAALDPKRLICMLFPEVGIPGVVLREQRSEFRHTENCPVTMFRLRTFELPYRACCPTTDLDPKRTSSRVVLSRPICLPHSHQAECHRLGQEQGPVAHHCSDLGQECFYNSNHDSNHDHMPRHGEPQFYTGFEEPACFRCLPMRNLVSSWLHTNANSRQRFC